MTNNEIVEQVYQTYKLKSLIKKMIRESSLDESFKDMEQLIYFQLLKMDNEKLNGLFNRNELIKWISQIIRNQRNYYKNEYQKNKLFEHALPTHNELGRLYTEHNFLLDWLDEELNKFDWNKDMTKEELVSAGEYEIMKFYLSSGYSMSRIAKLFNCSTTKINQMILSAKNNIKESYDKTFEVWNEKNSIITDRV